MPNHKQGTFSPWKEIVLNGCIINLRADHEVTSNELFRIAEQLNNGYSSGEKNPVGTEWKLIERI